jgi:hypothetical protein
MIRTTLAAFALTALLATTGFAGECYSCGGGGYRGPIGPRVYGGYGTANHWDGYCGDSCGGCGNCNSCGCCFPILKHTLHKIGRAVDCLIPDPCCRRQACAYRYPSPNCCDPAMGMDAGYLPAGPGMNDPFLDDQVVPTKPVPTPMPMKDARMRTSRAPMARPTAAPAKAVAKPVPHKVAAASKALGKPVVSSKSTGKSVLKVSYEDEVATASVSDVADVDAPPAAPVSIRTLRQEQPARITAKPVIRQRSSIEMPSNPLR